MIRTKPLGYNIAVASEAAAEAGRQLDNVVDAWAHGFALGLAIALRAPKTGRSIRTEMERRAAKVSGKSPEELEVALRAIVDLFDLSEDG